jgi:hypothetical protein
MSLRVEGIEYNSRTVGSVQKRKGGERKFEKLMAQYEHFRAPWLLNVPSGLIFTIYTFCPQGVLMCFVWI